MDTGTNNQSRSTRYYFVDEAGDSTLFSRKKKGVSIIGSPGCSQYFMLGFIYLKQRTVVDALLDYRRQILTNDETCRIPSIRKRQANFAFHAKDDPAIIRERVFEILRAYAHHISFTAIIRDKAAVLAKVRALNQTSPEYRYHENELYDDFVRSLFVSQLHRHDVYQLFFSRRGKADRTEALRTALVNTRKRYCTKWGITREATIAVAACNPNEHMELQIVDYLMWAVQRYYEREEPGYLEMIWPSCRLIHDLDAAGTPSRGRYTQRQPLFPGQLERQVAGVADTGMPGI